MKRKTKKKIPVILIKVLLIGLLLWGMFQINNKFSNEISLLAVSEDESGQTKSGSLIKLKLTIEEGTGETFVNLKTINELDTQVSIIDSQKVACDLFSLDCSKYDFHYEFDGSSIILKGPSASAAIAVLAAKTINHVKLDDKTVMTGTLTSGGVIGSVGGVNEKIQLAEALDYKKVLVPRFSNYTKQNRSIEVIEALDVIDAYNAYNGPNFKLKTKEKSDEEYQKLMELLAKDMCDRSNQILEQINKEDIKENTTIQKTFKQAQTSMNASLYAKIQKNYYSQGSFCYNANIFLRRTLEIQENSSIEELDNKSSSLDKEIKEFKQKISSDEYKENIQTLGDLYVYMIINDRVEEALEYIKIAKEDPLDKLKESLDNTTSKRDEVEIRNAFSSAKERFYTVNLWEKFLSHEGDKINLDENKLHEICKKILKENTIKEQLIQTYGVTFLNNELQDVAKYSISKDSAALCIYRGLELNGRINTIINSVGITPSNLENNTIEMYELALTRISHNSKGAFPLLPHIYLEYSGDLIHQEDYSSALLYSNYALSYTDLNLLLKEEKYDFNFWENFINKLFDNPIFIGAVLVIIAFL